MGALLPVALLATACSSDVSSHLDDRREQTSTTTVASIYGKDVTEFSVQCPGVGQQAMSKALSIADDIAKDNSDMETKYQHVYLRDKSGEVSVESVKLDDADFCGSYVGGIYATPRLKTARDTFAGWLPAETRLRFQKPQREQPWQLTLPLEK